jgi:hypothetical protein
VATALDRHHGGYQTFCVNGVFRKDKENANGREEQIGCSAG